MNGFLAEFRKVLELTPENLRLRAMENLSIEALYGALKALDLAEFAEAQKYRGRIEAILREKIDRRTLDNQEASLQQQGRNNRLTKAAAILAGLSAAVALGSLLISLLK